MAGGWASTLGAAILGGQSGYQEGKQNELRNLLNAIQLKLSQDQLSELPKKHAESDVDRQFARDGAMAYNDPNFVKNNAIAGQPLQTVPVPTFLDSSKLGPGGVTSDTKADAAKAGGFAPQTGAVIPPALQLKERQQKQALTQSDLITQFMQEQIGGSPSGAIPNPQPTALPAGGVGLGDDPSFPNGVKQYVVKLKQTYPGDSAGARAELQRAWPDLVKDHPNLDPNKVLSNFPAQAEEPKLGQVPPNLGAPEPPWEDPAVKKQRLMGKLTGIDTAEPPHESAAHKVFMANAEGVAKASFKPPAAALQRESEAYAKARLLIPQLRESLMSQVIDKNDPTGQQANPLRMGLHMAANAGKNAAYNAGYPLSDAASKAQQLSGLLTIVGATPYMQGSRSMQMFTKAAQHLTDPALTPEARIQRLNEVEQIFPEFEKAMPEATLAYQHAMQQAQQGGPGTAQPAANTPAPAVNKNRSLAEVNALASQTRQTPKSIIDQIHAAGGTVDGK